MTKEAHASLKKILNTIEINLTALEALKRPVGKWDDLLIDLIPSKFDLTTNKEWESTFITNEPPTMNQILEFINQKCNVL